MFNIFTKVLPKKKNGILKVKKMCKYNDSDIKKSYFQSRSIPSALRHKSYPGQYGSPVVLSQTQGVCFSATGFTIVFALSVTFLVAIVIVTVYLLRPQTKA